MFRRRTAFGPQLKARPTTYRGIDMRSRLEARIAAVLDANTDDWLWEYEPRAFAGHGGQYLPDFELRLNTKRWPGSHLPVYLEVKPTEAAAREAYGQMQVIRESRACTLAVVWPDETNRLVFAVDCECSACGVLGYWRSAATPNEPSGREVRRIHA